MKKIILFFGLLIACSGIANAQKFALVDMEYILKNISTYETANEQLEVISKRWQAEVEKVQQEAQNLYKNYQSELVYLTADQKKQKEEAIVAKEKQAQELKRKYFGPEGELFKKREALIQPIQDDIYEAIKEVSEAKGYQLVLDRASASSVIFASPRIDISNEILSKLGYSK